MIKIKEAIYGSYDGETLPLTDPEVNRVFKRTLVTFCLSRMRSHPQERNKLVSLFKEEMERFFQPQP